MNPSKGVRYVTKKIINYSFKLKDYGATKARHLVQMTKVRKLAKWDNVMATDWLEQIEYYIKAGGLGNGSYFHEFSIRREDGRLHNFRQSQAKTNEVKTVINATTRNYIQAGLEYADLPKSWDTAFYLVHYATINKGMERLVKFYI